MLNTIILGISLLGLSCTKSGFFFSKVRQPVVCTNNHVFCSICIDLWLKNNSQCPACRVPITPENPCKEIIGMGLFYMCTRIDLRQLINIWEKSDIKFSFLQINILDLIVIISSVSSTVDCEGSRNNPQVTCSLQQSLPENRNINGLKSQELKVEGQGYRKEGDGL